MATKTPDGLGAACKEFEQDVVLYHYQECPEIDRRKVASHLESCAGCRRFLDELQSLLPATVAADEPPPAFWQSYSREVRIKLAEEEENRGWLGAVAAFFHPWPVPAAATAVILAVAMGLTYTKTHWYPAASDTAPEFNYMASNADFFKSLDFLDSMDLMESVETPEAQKSETSRPL